MKWPSSSKGLSNVAHLHNRSFHALYVCASMDTHMCTQAYVCTHTHSDTPIHTCIHTHIHTHKPAPGHTHTRFKDLHEVLWIIELSGTSWQSFPLTLIPMAWHMQIKEWVVMEITPWFERSSFQCSWILPPQLILCIRCTFEQSCDNEELKLILPTVGPECSGCSYYMEER